MLEVFTRYCSNMNLLEQFGVWNEFFVKSRAIDHGSPSFRFPWIDCAASLY